MWLKASQLALQAVFSHLILFSEGINHLHLFKTCLNWLYNNSNFGSWRSLFALSFSKVSELKQMLKMRKESFKTLLCLWKNEDKQTVCYFVFIPLTANSPMCSVTSARTFQNNPSNERKLEHPIKNPKPHNAINI